MVTTPPPVEALLIDLRAAGIRLSVRGVRLIVDAPTGAVTPDLAAAIRRHRVELIHALRVEGPCEGCGSAEFVDTPIHGGKSTRRDCARCNRTWGFPVWMPEAER